MKKKLLSSILALVMVLSLPPVTALADEKTVEIDSSEDLVAAI